MALNDVKTARPRGRVFFVCVSESNIRIHTSHNRVCLAIGLVGHLRIREYARKTIFDFFFKTPLTRRRGI
jgi:hypothetical protein